MNKLPDSEKLSLDGPAGALEALLELPKDGDPVAAGVVCHPHPLHGGSLQNKVVHTLARAFIAQGIATLRFNFRGVGLSEGEFDEGHGELADVLAAADWMQRRYVGLPLWLGGFSFGGAMAIRAAVERPCAGLVSVAPAVSRFAASLRSQPACPWLIVQGDEDELVDIDETVAYVDSLEPGPRLAVIPAGEHFFHGRLVELRETVEAFIGEVRADRERG